MQKLDGRTDPQGAPFINGEHLGGLRNDERPQPFAAAQAGIAHGLKHTCFSVIRFRQQEFHYALNLARGRRDRVFKLGHVRWRS